MTVTAPAKINLSLRVLARREDGFHAIESLMVPISLADTLEITRLEAGELQFVCDDPSLPIDDTNLVVRAAKLFGTTCGLTPGVRIALPHQDAVCVLLLVGEVAGDIAGWHPDTAQEQRCRGGEDLTVGSLVRLLC